MTQAGIEVFRDLRIQASQVSLADVRASLLSAQTDEWVHGAEQESNLRQHAVGANGEDILVFLYKGVALPKSILTLWQRSDAYRVSNIIPAEVNQLDVKQYNSVLMNFIATVVDNCDQRAAITLDLTDDIRTLDTWTSSLAAQALSLFSALANKNTTNSHPTDHERWEAFVILAHQCKNKLPVDILMQWLIEVDGWGETSASELAIDFEKGTSLLESYDTAIGV